MLLRADSVIGCALQARDGEIGGVDDLLFEDGGWRVRWLVADTGTWLPGRRVLVPASRLGPTGAGRTTIPVDLTRDALRGCPDVDTDRPVSRATEASLVDHYGLATSAGLASAPLVPSRYLGVGMLPPVPGAPTVDPMAPAPASVEAAPDLPPHAPESASDLRSMLDLTGYEVLGADGPVGQVVDGLVDGEVWEIRSLVIGTGTWWPGRRLLLGRDWIDEIDYPTRAVRVGRSGEEIKGLPAYDPDR